MGDKTEEATEQRLQKSRDDGDSGVSAFASQALAFLVAVALIPAALSAFVAREEELLRATIQLSGSTHVRVKLDGLVLAEDVLAMTLPLLGAVALTATIASTLQAGGAFATKKLAPDLSRLDPFAGFARLFSLDRLFSVARAFVAAGFVAWLTVSLLRAALPDLGHATGDLAAATALAGYLSGKLLKDAAFVGIGVAAIDLLVTRRSWLKRLRMSKDEVKRERKDSDGDPQVKAARERAHHEVMTSVILAKVKEASVVVVNPTHLACALRYEAGGEDGGDAAPVLVASGRGELAEQIIRAAHDYGVPVLRDVPLARALIELEAGDAIPEALYEAVAEILRAAWEEV